jgi:pimeloyl-[acyl-carrier protein] methyl ester esterase
LIFTLHGWSFDRRVWEGTLFEKGTHLELPGHGESHFKSKGLLELAREIGETLPQSSVLVGWSLGSTVSLLISHLFPEKIEEIYLFSPTLKFSGISQPKVVVERFIRKLRRNFKKTVTEFRELCSNEKSHLPKLEIETSTELLIDFCHFDLTPYVRGISQPVKIFVGERDRITELEGALSLFKNLKRAELSVFPDADHLTVLGKLSS